MLALSLLSSLGLGMISSPFILCLMVVLLITWGCGMVGMFSSLWVGYSVAIVFLGGMMVLFTYASSMSTSDKFESRGSLGMVLWTLVGIFSFSFTMDVKLVMSSFYAGVGVLYLLISTLYLLVCLFLCVKLVEVHKGALLI